MKRELKDSLNLLSCKLLIPESHEKRVESRGALELVGNITVENLMKRELKARSGTVHGLLCIYGIS